MYDQSKLVFSPTARILYSFLRIFFQLLYNTFAWSYDLVAAFVSLGRWNDWVRSVLPYLTGDRILEIGHGPGHLQRALAEGHPTGLIVGLDLSRNMGKIAKRRLARAGHTPRLINGRAERLPFLPEKFTHLVATFPAEYIFHPDTLKEAWRVLAPGGSLVLLPLSWITGKAFLERLAAWLFKVTGQAPIWDDRALTPLHQLGFITHLEWISYRSSTVLVILADKPQLL